MQPPGLKAMPIFSSPLLLHKVRIDEKGVDPVESNDGQGNVMGGRNPFFSVVNVQMVVHQFLQARTLNIFATLQLSSNYLLINSVGLAGMSVTCHISLAQAVFACLKNLSPFFGKKIQGYGGRFGY